MEIGVWRCFLGVLEFGVVVGIGGDGCLVGDVDVVGDFVSDCGDVVCWVSGCGFVLVFGG